MTNDQFEVIIGEATGHVVAEEKVTPGMVKSVTKGNCLNFLIENVYLSIYLSNLNCSGVRPDENSNSQATFIHTVFNRQHFKFYPTSGWLESQKREMWSEITLTICLALVTSQEPLSMQASAVINLINFLEQIVRD